MLLLQGINGCLCMLHIDLLDILQLTQAADHRHNLIACCLKGGLPGIRIVACHIVVGMVACYFTLRSGGKTLLTFLFDSVSMWILNLPVAFILAHFTGLPLISMYAVVQIVDALKTLLGLYLVKKGIWINNLT